MGEVIFITGLIGGLLGWTFLLKGKARLYWLITMSVIGATVGIMEIIGTVVEGMTISQMFWRWSVTHVWEAYTAMSLLLFGIVVLIVHLMWKVWTNRNYKRDITDDKK